MAKVQPWVNITLILFIYLETSWACEVSVGSKSYTFVQGGCRDCPTGQGLTNLAINQFAADIKQGNIARYASYESETSSDSGDGEVAIKELKIRQQAAKERGEVNAGMVEFRGEYWNVDVDVDTCKEIPGSRYEKAQHGNEGPYGTGPRIANGESSIQIKCDITFYNPQPCEQTAIYKAATANELSPPPPKSSPPPELYPPPPELSPPPPELSPPPPELFSPPPLVVKAVWTMECTQSVETYVPRDGELDICTSQHGSTCAVANTRTLHYAGTTNLLGFVVCPQYYPGVGTQPAQIIKPDTCCNFEFSCHCTENN